jgi:ribosomal protein S18 acetylase RimI-like enzyme
MLIFTHDRERLHELFRRDPVMYAYHLGDLDEFFFGRCQWAASYYKSTRIDECVLIYHAAAGSTVLAFGHSERFESLLTESLDLLPQDFYAHFLSEYRDILGSKYTESPIGTSLRMRLESYVRQHCHDDARAIRRLTAADGNALLAFYDAAYPLHYFEKRMLELGKYIGWYEGNRLIAAAGVHVYAPQYGVAVLGNIATDPEFRGRGLATRLTSVLTEELAGEGLTLCLNVAKSNSPAVRCYEKVGFVTAFEFEESRFEMK